MSTAVIEYEYKGFTPAPDLLGYDIQGQIVHAVGVIVSTSRAYLAELRTELEEAGLTRAGTAKPRESLEVYGSKWREVWRSDHVVDHFEPSPRAQKARRESAARTRLYQSRKEEREMGKYDHQLKDLASKAAAKHPNLGDRPEKAAELVRRGHVQHKSSSRFTVTSQDRKREYFVDTEARSCTCRDYKWAPTVCNAPMCKHRLACLMVIKLDAHTSLAQPRAQGGRLAVEAARKGVAILI